MYAIKTYTITYGTIIFIESQNHFTKLNISDASAVTAIGILLLLPGLIRLTNAKQLSNAIRLECYTQ